MNTSPPNQDLLVEHSQWRQTCSHYWSASTLWFSGLYGTIRPLNGGISKQCYSKIHKLKVNNPLLSSPIASNPTVKTPSGSNSAVKNPRANNIMVHYPKVNNPRASYFGKLEYIIYNELLVSPKERWYLKLVTTRPLSTKHWTRIFF